MTDCSSAPNVVGVFPAKLRASKAQRSREYLRRCDVQVDGFGYRINPGVASAWPVPDDAIGREMHDEVFEQIPGVVLAVRHAGRSTRDCGQGGQRRPESEAAAVVGYLQAQERQEELEHRQPEIP